MPERTPSDQLPRTLEQGQDGPAKTVDLGPLSDSARLAAGQATRAEAGEGPTLGRYRVVGRLGVGGMGEVLEVVDPAIGREVAVKVILGEPSAEQVERFALEAQVTGQLEHPNIISVHEFGETTDRQLYFTMKKVDGVGLDELVDALAEGEREMPLSERVGLLMKVCDAVAFAHSRRVLHRDLKPANVMVGTFGETVVMDWGLAKIVGHAEGDAVRADIDEAVSGQTMDGAVKGTPAYMSPEQARGEVDLIDERSDVYSLGALLYELVALVPPFEGEVHHVLDQVADGLLQRPSVRAHGGAVVPWELEAVVLKAMALEPDARYQSASELRAELVRWLDGRTLSAADYSLRQWFAKWLRRNRAFGAVLAIALVIGVAAIAAVRQQREAERLAEARVLADKIARVVQTVDAQLEKLPVLDALRKATAAAAASKAPSDRSDDRRRWRAPLGGYLRLCSLVDRGLALDGRSDALRVRRLRVGILLGHCATLSGDYTLAAQAFADLKRFGVDEAQREALRAGVERARTAQRRVRAQRLARLIADVGLGLHSEERSFVGWSMSDYVFEAVALADEQTVGTLARVLRPLIERGAKHAERAQWRTAERDTIAFCCQVLARVGRVEAIGPLGELMAVVWDADLAAEAGRALCDTRMPEAYEHLYQAKNRLGGSSIAWDRIYGSMAKLGQSATRTVVGGSLQSKALFHFHTRNWVKALELFDQFLLSEPRDGSALLRRGLCHHELRQYRKALADFAVVLELDARNLSALVNSSLALNALGRPQEAIDFASRALAIKRDASFILARASAYMRLGRYEDALTDARQAIRLARRDASAHITAALAHNALGRVEQAMESVQRALVRDPRSVGGRALRARLHLKLGHVALALDDAQTLVSEAPRSSMARCLRAMIRIRQERYDEAMDDLQVVLSIDANNFEALHARGIVKSHCGDYEGALADMRRASKRHPHEPSIKVSQAIVLRKQGRPHDAVALLDKVIERQSTSAEAYNERSVARHACGDVEGAADDAARVTLLRPAWSTGWSNAGQLAIGLKLWTKARSLLDRAIAVDPRNYFAYYYRAQLRRRQKDNAGAIEDLGRAIDIDPKAASARVNRGDLLSRMGRSKEAVDDFKVAVQLAPDLWQAWTGLGQAYMRLKAYASAAQALRRAVANAPQRVQPALQRLLQEAEAGK